jgi:hypothetical protein
MEDFHSGAPHLGAAYAAENSIRSDFLDLGNKMGAVKIA